MVTMIALMVRNVLKHNVYQDVLAISTVAMGSNVTKAHVSNHVSLIKTARKVNIVILIKRYAKQNAYKMQTVLVDTHVLKENVDCIAVYQNIATPISTVTGNIRVHIITECK